MEVKHTKDFIYYICIDKTLMYLIRRKDLNYNCFSKKGELYGFMMIDTDSEYAYFYDRNSICRNRIPIKEILMNQLN